MTGTATIHEQVRHYYGSLLTSTDDLKTDVCCAATDAPPKYVLDIMPLIADEIIERFYGCGSPIPPALKKATVLDLGCGTGRDVYVASKLVGEAGRVIGIDMTEEQLCVARAYRDEQARSFGYEHSNVEFKGGYIEDLQALGIEDESVDVVISNCVINLSPFKEQVFSEIYRVLKPGGELFFSDVFADRRIPAHLQNDPVLRGECLGGALYVDDFLTMTHELGWRSVEFVHNEDIAVNDFELQTKLGFIGFTSRTVRAIKASGLEESEEDYGIHVVYKGGIEEMPRYFDFNEHIRFIRDKPHAVSGNTARALEQSRYGTYFSFSPRRKHRGRFNLEQAQDALNYRRGIRRVDLAALQETCVRCGIEPFDQRVGESSLLTPGKRPSTLQVNICYSCNLTCGHCYLECGPQRNEQMSRSTMEEVLGAFERGGFSVMDITGGAPELHEDFVWFLTEAAKRGQTIVRSNMVLLGDDRHSDYAEQLLSLYQQTRSRIVVSLPFYNASGTDTQRGNGVFARAIAGIRKLNERGYGRDPELTLDLVYNVSGPFLPPPQELIEEAYQDVLAREQGIVFDKLLAFNNYPLGRFALDLKDAGMFDEYCKHLADNFNALAVVNMMCREQVNVDIDGRLYDCECNHVLGLPITVGDDELSIGDLARDGELIDALVDRSIKTHPVCYSCAAGSGSSCGGSLV